MNWVLIRLICCFPTMWLLLHVITSPCDYFSMVSPCCIQCPQGSWDQHFLHRRIVPTGGSLCSIPENGILVASRCHKDQRQQRRGKDGRKGGREKVISSWWLFPCLQAIYSVLTGCVCNNLILVREFLCCTTVVLMHSKVPVPLRLFTGWLSNALADRGCLSSRWCH